MEFTTQFGEIKRVHRNFARVVGLRNAQMLTVQSDQVKRELSLLFLAFVVKTNLQRCGILVGSQDDSVFVASEFQHF